MNNMKDEFKINIGENELDFGLEAGIAAGVTFVAVLAIEGIGCGIKKLFNKKKAKKETAPTTTEEAVSKDQFKEVEAPIEAPKAEEAKPVEQQAAAS